VGIGCAAIAGAACTLTAAVAVLFAGDASMTPAGALTLAVSTTLPLAFEDKVAAMT
jgi:hypothetical protein